MRWSKKPANFILGSGVVRDYKLLTENVLPGARSDIFEGMRHEDLLELEVKEWSKNTYPNGSDRKKYQKWLIFILAIFHMVISFQRCEVAFPEQMN
jgi:hypothetical protein